MAGIVKKQRKNGVAWYIVLTPKQAASYGLERKRKWIGPFKLKEDAVKKREDLKSQIDKADDAVIRLTLQEAYDDWFATTDIAESTKDLYRKCWPHLKPLHDKCLSDIDRDEVKQLLEGLPFSKGRVKQVRTLLNHCFSASLTEGLLEASPTTNLKIKYNTPAESKELRFWTKEQAQQFLNIKPKPRFHLFYAMALHTGCRRGELLGLKWDCVNFNDNTIKIRVSYNAQFGLGDTKTTRSKRTIKLRDDEMVLLKENYDSSLIWVFQRPEKPTPISVNSIQNEFYRLCDGLNLPHIGLHGLRHTHATIALQARTPVEVVSRRLGHSTPSMTLDVYRHIIPAEDKELADTLGALLD